MTNREHLIRERAYSLWETEGSPSGKHEDHWQQAEREIDGGNSGLAASDAPSPPEMDLEPIPLPFAAGTDDQDVPPARTGQSENSKDPVESGGADNPVHHTGEQPLSPLSK
ncbi:MULTISPECIES: DUF2934 domain-containing protein [unclassified Rhizobium]|uniref:DUF2934 domain-containing protein n=1 Tax=unclassified Rhizobium TaxID=2613769 RepID=UPI0007143366|nr:MULTISPECIES: DUF2934 domain-containing protein [unclassified Rhizobium]KQS85778.1 hypothetical protein ASG50_28910 [Rhizobium sp. Leaf386]KQU06018.1 hypothetical protein ASG68_25085 [Rhizobium sp. Leaf453]